MGEARHRERTSKVEPSKCHCYAQGRDGFPNTLPRSLNPNSNQTKVCNGLACDIASDGLPAHRGSAMSCEGSREEDVNNRYRSLQIQHNGHNDKVLQCTCKFKYTKSGFHIWSSRVCHNRNMDGALTEVYISINSKFAHSGCNKNSSLCEKLLGIVPGVLPRDCPVDSKNNLNVSQKKGTCEKNEGPVCVKGLVPDSSALRCRKIKAGQVLLTINDCRVSWRTVDAVLSELQASRNSNKVKLTLKTLPVHETCAPVLRKRNLLSGQVISHAVNGDNCSPLPPGGSVLYLTLDETEKEENGGKENVLYQFPKTGSKVEAIRGAFITLSHTLKDLTDTPTKSSSLLIDSSPCQVCYHVEGRNLLIMAAAACRKSLFELETILSDLVRLLHVLYGTIDCAFTDPGNHPSLDHLFTMVYQCFLGADRRETVAFPYLSCLPSAQALLLSEEVKGQLSTELSSFEAGDFADKSDDKCGVRRAYTILGSCVFYKGHLLTSHLPTSDLLDIHLFLAYHGLLHLGDNWPVKQLIFWQEIFPTRRCQDVPEKHVFGYFEPDGRWFLLIVGVEHGLLCVLLESGGCCTRMEGSPTPDCFFIDQAKATLLQLMSSQLIKHCELRLQSGVIPSLSADWFYNGKQNNMQPTVRWSGDLINQISNPTDRDYIVRSNRLDKNSPLTVPLDSPTFQRSASLNGTISGIGDKGHRLARSSDLSGLKSCVIPSSHSSRLSVRGDTSLFHYLYFDSVEAVFIASPPHIQGPVHRELMKNFHQTCLSIRKLFGLSQRVQTLLDEDSERCFGVDVTFDLVEEHGILFQYKPEWPHAAKKSQTLTYWVVGRVFSKPMPQELYVCFHESTPQNLVELAFRLSFGHSLQ
ncbi:protein inturned-like [Liolophura sinensis]|uniref:protein inturned-like n=1 Tax=Liolophura sinensis TaxID=3198878 RepID=UPI0031584CBD